MVAQDVQDSSRSKEGSLGQRNVDEDRGDGVQSCFVPECDRGGIEESRNGTDGCCARADGCAGVVLDAATNGNVGEGEVGAGEWSGREIYGTS